MTYKLMAVDIDGTLLDSHGRLTEETKCAIKQATEKGLLFILSTGRPMQGIRPLMDVLELDADLPLITYNGAMVVLGKSGKILYERNLSTADAKCIMKLGMKWNTHIAAWSGNRLYVNKLDDYAMQYASITGVTPEEIEDVDALAERGVTKVLWHDTLEAIEKFHREVGAHIGSDINYHISRPVFLEFVDKQASKGVAMESLGRYFGIRREEMIAVGDSYNDLSMIEYAGLGVVMSNAVEDIRQKADYITLSNDENGVAHVLYRFVLANT